MHRTRRILPAATITRGCLLGARWLAGSDWGDGGLDICDIAQQCENTLPCIAAKIIRAAGAIERDLVCATAHSQCIGCIARHRDDAAPAILRAGGIGGHRDCRGDSINELHPLSREVCLSQMRRHRRLALGTGDTRSGPPRYRADVRRRRAIVPAEGAIEVGEIAEPDLKGNRADGAPAVARVGQQMMRARQALAEHEFRECRAGAFKHRCADNYN